MKNALIDLLKVIARADPKSLFVRSITILVNSSVPPVITFLLGKTVLSLTNADMEKTVVLSVSYITVMFLWNIFLRYSGVVNVRLNDRLVIKLREHMTDLYQKIPQDIVESSDFIQLRKRGDDFLSIYALRFFGSAERLVTIVLTLVNYCIIFWGIHPVFIWIVLCASLPGFFCRAKFVPEMRRMYEELQEDRNYQGYYKNILTNPSALKELRVWGLEKTFYTRYLELTGKIHRRQTNHYYRHGFVGGGIESLAFGAGVIGSILLGIRLTASGIILIDGFVIVVTSILDVQDTFISAYYNILGYRESSYYAKDYLSIYHMANGLRNDSETASEDLPPKAFLRLQNVSFQYPLGRRRALEDVSVTIGWGEKIAVVGENGSGKTTFCKIILGLYQPDGGKVEYCSGIASSVTFQDFCRYHLSVRDNIVLGNVSLAGDVKAGILKAMKVSGFDEVCRTSGLTLDSILGTVSGDGVNLSGGEWQRLAIARCFYDDSKNLIVLDEPHASLDPRAEVKMYEYYGNIIGSEKKCLIFVTHRLTSAKMCDRILVFRKGRLVEDGSHSELLVRKGYYYKLYTAQSQNYRGEQI